MTERPKLSLPYPMPVPVALVTTELGVGGAERCVTRLAIGLDRTRFDPMVISLKPPPPPGRDALVRQLRAANVPLEFLRLDAWRSLGAAWYGLRRALARRPVRLVQSFLFHANVLCAAARSRSAIHVGGVRVADPRRGRDVWDRWAARGMQRVVCVSESVAQFCRDVQRLPERKLKVIVNGLDVAAYVDAPPADLHSQASLPADAEMVVFLGRLDRQKGLDLLLAHWAEVIVQRPTLHLMLVGEGHEHASLDAQSRQLGLQSNVHFLGWREDAASILKAARLLVLPSRWEGLPNAVLEAMACGLPVVASDVHGVRELLGKRHSQRQIVPVGEGAALAAAILAFFTTEGLAEACGKANQERAMQRFSVQAMVGAYESLYGELLFGPDA